MQQPPVLNPPALPVSESALLRLRHAKGRRVTCLAGSLWLSEAGGREDIHLQAGESATIRSPGLVLVGSLAQGLAALSPAPSVVARTTSAGRSLHRRLLKFLQVGG